MANQRRSSKRQINLWIEEDTKKRLTELAERTGTSLSQLVADLILEELTVQQEKEKKTTGKKRKPKSRGQ